MSAWYNEIDPYCAEWLRNLIAAGEIPPGDVDERPIEEVSGDEIKNYTQCHFFAGIGGWAYAARLAGWRDSDRLWTGSCPCQPFSQAGKRLADRDPRNLWPHFARLIAECRPPRVAGEQVASKAGRLWLAGVREDMEALGYAVGAADLCAAGVSAPHIRQRLWWLSDAGSERRQQERRSASGDEATNGQARRVGQQPDGDHVVTGYGEGGRLGHTDHQGSQGRGVLRERADELPAGPAGMDGGLPDAECCDGQQECTHAGRRGEGSGAQRLDERSGRAGAWDDAIWIPCADGKARRIEPGIEPLAHGVPARVGKLRAYGNAIVPQVAAEVLMAWREAI